jgi:hypothetical protein
LDDLRVACNDAAATAERGEHQAAEHAQRLADTHQAVQADLRLAADDVSGRRGGAGGLGLQA